MAERYQKLTEKLVNRIELIMKASRDAEADTDIDVKINQDDTAEIKIESCGLTRREKINQPASNL